MRRLGSIALVGAAGATTATGFQKWSERNDLRRWPPPGRMVEIEPGRRIHVRDHPGPGPTLVIETGSGSLASSWEPIIEQLGAFARVVSYDRAGYGWSDRPGTWKARSGRHVAADLDTALDAAGIEPPWVLVGHSLGGLYVRHLQRRRPDAVAGLVLVDSSHEEMVERARTQLGAAAVLAQKAAVLALALPPRSLARAVRATSAGRHRLTFLFKSSEDEDNRRQIALYLRDGFRQASLAEGLGMKAAMAELRASRSVLPIPVVVITAAKPKAEDEGMLARLRPLWEELQQDLVSLSDTGRQVIALRGGHFVYLDDPDCVVEAIRSLVEELEVGTRR